ncbi:MAG TPA: hypothetical protein VJ735_06840 [Actinomycetes bacterium]|nr:hypothetical protein [Actinomycetes bacterium]
MELLVGLLGALLGTAAGGLSVFLTSRAQMRRELEYAYDRELRARRIEAYMSFYKRTDKLPRYWRTNPRRMELSDSSQAFDGWYFGEAGGLFLSDEARRAYLEMLGVMATVAGEGGGQDQLPDEDIERLWRAGQALRRKLAADIGAAEDPRLAGRLPAMSPPPAVRMKNRK